MEQERKAELLASKAAVVALLGNRPVAYHPVLAEAMGGVAAGVFLSQFLYWHGKGADPEGWVYKTRDEIAAETALSRWEQQTVRKRLVGLGVLEEQVRGFPRKVHFRINTDRLVDLLGAYLFRDPPSAEEAAAPVPNPPPDQARTAQVGRLRAEQEKVEAAVLASNHPQAVVASWASWVSGESVAPGLIGALANRLLEATPHRFQRGERPATFKDVCRTLVKLTAQAVLDAPPEVPYIACLNRFCDEWAGIPRIDRGSKQRAAELREQAEQGVLAVTCPLQVADNDGEGPGVL